jgi:hypothetical protein
MRCSAGLAVAMKDDLCLPGRSLGGGWVSS